MGFWIFMLTFVLLIPLSMIGFGRSFMKYSPKNINYLFGYRTKMSMKNKETWEFAHKHIGRIWFVLGLIIFPISILPLLFFVEDTADTIGSVGSIIMIVQSVILLGSIFPTSIALNKTFTKDGKRK